MLNYCQGLRIYGVYYLDQYPDWKILVTDIPEYNGKHCLRGLAFNKWGAFETAVELKLPVEGKEIGYVYGNDSTMRMFLY